MQKAAPASSRPEPQAGYAGFWIRTLASLIDTLWMMLLLTPLLVYFYGWEYFDPYQSPPIDGLVDVLLTWVLPAVVVLLFWRVKQATPGKMLVHARVVDARSLQPPGSGQLIIRYLGYFLATIPLGLGLIWVAFDSRKQGWHDKLAGTLVIYEQPARSTSITQAQSNP
ncbi:MAG: RDD family protein [Halopseudomonas sp.]|uniref:RDD family protein n=1 Tax=Halopseudomonas sp. TaxID=2901191 RepID=UPI003002DF2A